MNCSNTLCPIAGSCRINVMNSAPTDNVIWYTPEYTILGAKCSNYSAIPVTVSNHTTIRGDIAVLQC